MINSGTSCILNFRIIFLKRGLKFIFALFMTSPIYGHAADTNSWQRRPATDQMQNRVNLPKVPKTDIYEVVPTKIDTALAWHLEKKPFAVLTCSDADFLTGGHYTCDANRKPVLARAVYTNGGTGAFLISYDNGVLYIIHGSLGRPGEVKNIPIIVNLPFTPVEVFAWITGAI